MSGSDAVLRALAVTAEVCGGQISEAAALVMLEDLASFPEAAVIEALKRVRRECRGRLTLADILSRLDGGQPNTATAISDQAAEWWEVVADIVSEGKYFTGYPVLDAVMRRVGIERLRNMGDGTSGTENRTFVRRDFVQVWRDYAAAHPSEYAQAMGFDEPDDRALGRSVEAAQPALRRAGA